MWNKSTRKDEEYLTPALEETARKAMQPTTSQSPEPAEPLRSEALRAGHVATIGKSVVVKGELSGSEDLYVDGEVEGSISLRGQSLTVGPNGRVRANIEARNVIVHGHVDGNLRASDRVDLRKSAALTGDISTARISIEDGAYFKGTIAIQKSEPAPRTEPKQATITPASPVAVLAAQGSLLEHK